MNTAQVTRLVMLIIGLIIGWYLLSTLFMVTFPFLLATFLAFLMNPLVTLFEKQIKLPRTLSVMVAIFFIFGVLGTLITLIIWLVIDGVVYLSHYIPPYIEKASVALQFYMNEHILPFWNSSIGFIERLERINALFWRMALNS